MRQPHKPFSLMLTDDQIRLILERTLEHNPNDYPYVLATIVFRQIMAHEFDKYCEQFDKHMTKFEDDINQW